MSKRPRTLPLVIRLAIATVLGAAALTGCGDDDASSGVDRSETLTARLVSASPDGSVDIDRVEVLSGEAALAAARADGAIGPDEDLPNDVYLADADDEVESLGVDPQARLEVLDCTRECRLVPADIDDLLTGRLDPYGGPRAVWTIEVVDDTVQSFSEVYLP